MICYFAFYRGKAESIWTIFGHVEICIAQDSKTWLFLNPSRQRFFIYASQHADTIDELLALRLGNADCVLRYEREPRLLTLPPIAIQTCASICAHIVGLRAWTPKGLKRKLLANGAQVVEPCKNPKPTQK